LSGQNGRAYLDANICIYHFEGIVEHALRLDRLVREAANSVLLLLTSEITLTEMLVPAFLANNDEKVRKCVEWLEGGSFVQLVPVTRDAHKNAALLRARHRLKTPDAIHVASAIDANCRFFITNDIRLRVPVKMELVNLRDI